MLWQEQVPEKKISDRINECDSIPDCGDMYLLHLIITHLTNDHGLPGM